MANLEQLREITDRNLSGLKADTRLLHQILNAKESRPVRKVHVRPVLAVSIAAAVVLAAGLLAIPVFQNQETSIEVVSRSAGGQQPAQVMTLTANVPAGSVSIGESKAAAPAYSNLFAPAQNGNFPLVKVGSATYRLLDSSVSISSGMLGEPLGAVTEYTQEPAISSSAVVSNTLQAGQPVYAVRGMSGAAAAAEVNGTLRVFQRVSYAGTATVGGESLRDVLTGSAAPVSLALSDVGTITSASQAQELLAVLYANARLESTAASDAGGQSLLIRLDNGLTVQMNAGGGMLSACGSWSCPEFFDAFAETVAR